MRIVFISINQGRQLFDPRALVGGITFPMNCRGEIIPFRSGFSRFSRGTILSSKVKLGGDASAATGPVGRTASAETDVTLRAEILSYSRARGLFAGISLEGSTLRPDNGANKNLYGKEVSAKSIVFKKAVPAPESTKELLATLEKVSPKNKSKN
jgi:hypothetical protein